jgi:MFS family permease
MSGLLPVLLGISTSMPLALLATAVMGASQAGFMTLTHTMIQAITPDGIRGRVAAVYSVHIGGMMASANLINGGVAEWIDAPLVLMAGGFVFILVMVASWRGAVLRRIYVRGLRIEAVAAAD